MVELIQAVQNLKEKNILVLGDFMCDLYTKGKAHRVSPEAPVVILNVEELQRLAGGAGNVVLNLKTLGANVFPCGLIGEDEEGDALKKVFAEKSIPTEWIFQSDTVSTIVKNRLLADFQQLIRVDFEKKYHLDQKLEDAILKAILPKIKNFSVVAISDYQKGFLTLRILKEVIAEARRISIPVVVDPKGDDFSKYHGATIIKPNSKEAYHAAKLHESAPIQQVADHLLKMGNAESFIITRSENGMAYFTAKEARYFPVRVKEVVDVTGAGDTALAMICFSLANNFSIDTAISLANVASSIAIEKIGCAHVGLEAVTSRLMEFNAKDKLVTFFDFESLKEAISTTSYHLYLIEKLEPHDFTLFETLKKSLKEKNDSFKKIIYLKKIENAPLVLQILAIFQEIDSIVMDRKVMEEMVKINFPKTFQIVSKDLNTVVYEHEILNSVL
jgi:rfaE bifunctional protein kinase chain/domain